MQSHSSKSSPVLVKSSTVSYNSTEVVQSSSGVTCVLLEQYRLNNWSALCMIVGVNTGLQFVCCSMSVFSR